MILLDYSAVAIAGMMIAIKRDGEYLTKEFALHMILNSIRKANKKFHREYGEMIICCDAKSNWRKEVFPQYKFKRKKLKETDDIDWALIYECLEYTKNIIKKGFPYRVIEVNRTEADDIIGELSRLSTSNKEKSVIISNDKDFCQLINAYVDQFRPATEEYVNIPDTKRFLKELIIRGDTSDGIPNIKSNDDIFTLEGKRQTSIFKKELIIWLDDEYNEFLDPLDEKLKDKTNVKENFRRNNTLINLDCTPENLKKNIREEYNNTKVNINKKVMTEFFMDNKLRYLHEKINDFM
jgi:5'-3' exonuclease